MAITTLSSREFNQDASRAKRAARKGPVFITDRGRASHVLLTVEDYRKLTGKGENLVDLLSSREVAKVEFDPPRLEGSFFHTSDLS